MKVNLLAYQLIESGLSAKTVEKLTESQIKTLHSRLVKEQPQPQVINKTVKQIVLPAGSQTTVGGVSVSNTGGKTTVTPTTEEVTEEDDFDMDADQAYTGQKGSHDEYQSSDDGMDDDTSPQNKDRKMVGMTETKKKEQNPWAICTAQLGKEFGTSERSMWSSKQKNKYERCVKDVKTSLKEGKNPVSLFLENEIMKIVERNLPPRITKGDLLKYLSENGPATAPTKPVTKPTTKPGKPDVRPKPKHPGQNPMPGVKPGPKAISPDKAKDEILDLIKKILEK